MYKVKDLRGVGVEYSLDFNTMTTNEIKEFGRRILVDNVILVRNQTLSDEKVLEVCETIGHCMKPKQFFMHDKVPGLFRVTNERDEHGEKTGLFADKELDWHSNGNGRPSGKEACVALYCVRPGEDSVTSFCDTRRAYNELPNDIKEIVDDVECLFKFENNTFYNLDEDDKELIIFEQHPDFIDGINKPLVYEHPWTAEKGLYFTFHYIRKMWRRSGKSLDEVWLRKYLMEHIFQEKYIYHHDNWQPGDFVFMDQFHSIHKRNAVKGNRLLYRLSFDYRRLFK
jgi:alpha-ketoglutarate-dependent 2,4-dichlorophenoxyacetate dioxygenase